MKGLVASIFRYTNEAIGKFLKRIKNNNQNDD